MGALRRLRGTPRAFGPQPLGSLNRPTAGQPDEEDGELLPAQPHREISAARPVGEHVRHFAEHDVAAGMAEGVVDALEMVDVHHRHGDTRRGPAVVDREQPVHRVLQVATVVQARQRVADGALIHLDTLEIQRLVHELALHRDLQRRRDLGEDIADLRPDVHRIRQVQHRDGVDVVRGRRAQRHQQAPAGRAVMDDDRVRATPGVEQLADLRPGRSRGAPVVVA